MNLETTLSLSLIFALISMLGTIMAVVNNWKNSNEKETEKRLNIAEQFATINVKLDGMSSTISEIVKNHEKSMNEIQKINQTLVAEHERVETLFKYKDNHEERIKRLEKDIRRD